MDFLKHWEDGISKKMAKHIDDTIIGQITKVTVKPLTAKEIKQRKLQEKKEKIRRAKKKVITVGEYEDLLEERYF